MRKTIIYGLIDPRTNQLRYIGKTVSSLKKRLQQHVNDARRGRVSIRRFHWINSLSHAGIMPEIFELETTTDDWQGAEQFWIGYFRFIGAALVNATAGGDGLQNFTHSSETRRKQSDAAKLRYADPAERKRSGDAVRAAYRDPATRENLRNSLRNAWTLEARARARERSIMVCKRPEEFARRSAVHKGKIVSNETRAKLSAAKMGVKRTAESIAKQVATMIAKRTAEVAIAS